MKKKEEDANHSREQELIALARITESLKASMTYYATKGMVLELGIMQGFHMQTRERIVELAGEIEAQDSIAGIEYKFRSSL